KFDSVFINLGRCREVAYITLSSVRVKHFLLILFRISRCRFSVHRALRWLVPGQWMRIIGSRRIPATLFLRFFTVFSSTAAFHSKTPSYTHLRTDLSTDGKNSEKSPRITQTFALQLARKFGIDFILML
ncbi:TPA: hypothetical protein ACS72F_003481, partial [Providencia alcalifaciens]